jgi:hypothetical protein
MVASGAAPYLLGRWPLSGQRDTALYLRQMQDNKIRFEGPEILMLGTSPVSDFVFIRHLELIEQLVCCQETADP